MTTLNQEERLLTVQELCDFLKVDKDWVYSRTRKNNIPYVRVGPRLVRFKLSEISKWLETQKIVK